MTASAVPRTVAEILAASTAWLEERGVDGPRRSVELLMGHVLGLDRLQLYLQHDRPLTSSERDPLRALVLRRAEGEPVAHLLGSWEFYGYEFEVGPDVLVPRPETEELLERALAETPPAAPSRVVDLGTGSGALAVGYALERPASALIATDRSSAALAVARRNAARHAVEDRIEFLEGDWWAAVPAEARFDVLLSNPPYVDPARPELVEDAVSRFEPDLALWTPEGDPGACYRAIAAGCERHLAEGATLWLETGVGAAEAALAALEEQDCLEEVELSNDLAGHPRFLRAVRA